MTINIFVLNGDLNGKIVVVRFFFLSGIVYMAVKKGTVLVNISLLKIFFADNCRLYISSCVSA